MRVVVDHNPSDIAARTVGDAIQAGAELAESQGRMVVEVYVDGRQWTDQELTSEAHLGHDASEVSLITVEPREMVRQTLLDAVEVLDDAARLQREAAEDIQADQGETALKKLAESLSYWGMMQEATVKGSQLVGVNLDEIQSNDVPMQSGVDQLDAQLRSIREAVQRRDFVALSDSLLYEMPDLVETWQGLLRALAERVKP